MEDVLYRIPVFTHVKKFLACNVEVEPFKVTTHNEFGTILFMCLERKPHEHETPLILNDRMQIRIPKWYVDKQGPYISNKKIELFNTMVERMMIKELMILLDTGNKRKGDIKLIIDEFRDRYGIFDTELEYHNLRKHYVRYRGAKKQKSA